MISYNSGMTKPYLFLMMGMPGSGKSFVAEWLSPKLHAVHLRSDDMRLAMFGEPRLELHRNPAYRKQLYGAMDYAARQPLAAGHSVIYDANLNWRRSRARLRRMAEQYNATAVIIFLEMDTETAHQRVIERANHGGHPNFELSYVERMANNIEPPTADEPTITLDGKATDSEQQASFTKQLKSLNTLQ